MPVRRLSRLAASAVLLGAALTFSACDMMGQAGGSPTAPSGTSGASSAATTGTPGSATDAAFCISEINRLRGTIGLPALVTADDLTSFSNQAALVYGQAHQYHKYFLDTNGAGVSMAQNEIPWWVLSDWGSVHAVIAKGLAMMWAEGPGGGHYDNMTGNYSQAACGIAINNGEVTVTQDFR